MNPDTLKSVYFLGIGGIGMSALARYFAFRGANISGYDRSPTALTKTLTEEGMSIHFDESLNNIPQKIDLVVYTPAIKNDHPEFEYFMKQGIPMKKRAEVLGMISCKYKTIAVAGTHGKTTTSSLIAHILKTSDTRMLGFLGGIVKKYETNFLYSDSISILSRSQTDQPGYCVVEADEYDKSFLQLNPYIAIITSADADHLEIYGNHEALRRTFSDFTAQIVDGGKLIMKLGTPVIPEGGCRYTSFTYSLDQNSCFHAKNIRLERELYHFDFVTPTEIIRNMVLGVPGIFNLENAIAALSVGYLLGIDNTKLRKALLSYPGVQRRFDFRILRNDFIYIDDYAHHPEELRTCINAVRALFPNKKITGIFQPHLFTRTRDMADDFAHSLELLDELMLLEIYPAREKPIRGVNSQMLLDKVRLNKKCLLAKEQLLGELTKRSPEILLTLGAGDIDQLVQPITMAFERAEEKP